LVVGSLVGRCWIWVFYLFFNPTTTEMQTPELDELLTAYLVLNPSARAAVCHHLDLNFRMSSGDLKTGIASMVSGMHHMHYMHAMVHAENAMLRRRIAEMEMFTHNHHQ